MKRVFVALGLGFISKPASVVAPWRRVFVLLSVGFLVATALGACVTTDGAKILDPAQQIKGNPLRSVGGASLQAVIPRKGEDGTVIGLLQASWNPAEQISSRPTFIGLHGGHGIGSVERTYFLELHKKFGYNLLILDSYWSRGLSQNWSRSDKADGTVRTYDLISAAEWLISEKKVDPRQIYLIGGSQGGWTVLRAMTKGIPTEGKVKSLIRAGFAFYPVCDVGGLSPYHSDTFIFTGDADETTHPRTCHRGVLQSAKTHVNYPNAHHGFDTYEANGGNGCGKSLNPVKFTVCRDDGATSDSYSRIRAYVEAQR